MTTNHNSLLYWYPEVKGYFSTPETWTLSPPDITKWLDNGIPETWMKRIGALIDGKYPVFFRTDIASNKHEWSESCVIGSAEEIEHKVLNTLDFNFMVDLWPEHLVFREMLKPYGGPHMKNNGGFQAYEKFPVSRELRFFVEYGEVKCVHRYWAHEVFVLDRWAVRTVPKDWEKRWKKLYNIKEHEITELSGRIENDFSSILRKESWSVDFLYARKAHSPLYRWYLIDMAEAGTSYHFDHESDLISPNGKSVVLMNRRHELEKNILGDGQVVEFPLTEIIDSKEAD